MLHTIFNHKLINHLLNGSDILRCIQKTPSISSGQWRLICRDFARWHCQGIVQCDEGKCFLPNRIPTTVPANKTCRIQVKLASIKPQQNTTKHEHCAPRQSTNPLHNSCDVLYLTGAVDYIFCVLNTSFLKTSLEIRAGHQLCDWKVWYQDLSSGWLIWSGFTLCWDMECSSSYIYLWWTDQLLA